MAEACVRTWRTARGQTFRVLRWAMLRGRTPEAYLARVAARTSLAKATTFRAPEIAVPYRVHRLLTKRIITAAVPTTGHLRVTALSAVPTAGLRRIMGEVTTGPARATADRNRITAAATAVRCPVREVDPTAVQRLATNAAPLDDRCLRTAVGLLGTQRLRTVAAVVRLALTVAEVERSLMAVVAAVAVPEATAVEAVVAVTLPHQAAVEATMGAEAMAAIENGYFSTARAKIRRPILRAAFSFSGLIRLSVPLEQPEPDPTCPP